MDILRPAKLFISFGSSRADEGVGLAFQHRDQTGHVSNKANIEQKYLHVVDAIFHAKFVKIST